MRRPWLLALTVGLAGLEGLLLVWLAPRSALPLGVHVTAPEPFGVFHDLRWLLVYHPNRVAFAAEALLFLVFRTALTTSLLAAAWPDDVERPAWSRLAGRSLLFVVAAAASLLPLVTLVFGVAVVSLSWLFYVAVPMLLIVALLVHHGAVTRGWWRRPPPFRSFVWIGAVFTSLTVAGGIVASLPVWAAPAAIAATGLVNAWAWHGIVHGVVCRRPARRTVPLAPAGVAGIVVVALVGTSLGFRLGEPADQRDVVESVHPSGRQPVLVMSGFASEWDGEPSHRFPGPFDEHRFSYLGLFGDRPLPYTREHTLEALPELTDRLAHQVEAIAGRSGRHVSIVAESEGALLAKIYVTTHPEAPVDRLVMLSPLVSPGRVYYPPSSADGWGIVASWSLDGLAAVVRGLSPLSVDADSALFRSLNDHGPALRNLVSCPAVGVEQLVVTPVADAVTAGEVHDGAGLRVVAVPAFHGGLLGNGRVQDFVADELLGLHPAGSEAWSFGDRLVRALSATWQVPELASGLNPVWDDADATGPAPDGCPAAAELLTDATG